MMADGQQRIKTPAHEHRPPSGPHAATAQGVVRTVRLADVRLDADTQAREEISTMVTDEYAAAMRAGATFPPIVVFRDGTHLWLADGYHRVRAARQAGLYQFPAEIRPGSQRDAMLFAVGANATHGLRRTNADKRRAVSLLLADPEWSRWSNREIARRCGVDEGLVRKLRGSADSPQMRRTVTRGGTTYQQDTHNIGKRDTPHLDAAATIRADVRALIQETDLVENRQELAALAHLTPALQLTVAHLLVSGDAATVREAVRLHTRDTRQQLTQQEILTGHFPVIYADPPWQYRNGGFRGTAEEHYTPVSTQKLCQMPVADYTTSNAVLFLWATNPLLTDALEVMEAWGFRYATNLAWVKERATYGKLGFYAYGQHALLLIGVKGACLPQVGCLPSSVLNATAGQHREKPAAVYELIEQMYAGPYLALFLTHARAGWTSCCTLAPKLSSSVMVGAMLHSTLNIGPLGCPLGTRHPGVRSPAPGPSVLLIEDDPDVRSLLEIVLTVAGCTVTAVSDGETGLGIARTGAYDVMLTDWHLPGRSGQEIIQHLKTGGAGTRMIVMSGDPRDAESAIQCGADGYVAKDGELSDLVAWVMRTEGLRAGGIAPTVRKGDEGW